MFMQYTHYGIGHPKVLWEMARDCADIDLADDLEPEEDGGWERDLRSSESDGRRDGDDDDECSVDEQFDDDHPDDWEIRSAEVEEDDNGSF
jgi:hypothetical protein